MIECDDNYDESRKKLLDNRIKIIKDMYPDKEYSDELIKQLKEDYNNGIDLW